MGVLSLIPTSFYWIFFIQSKKAGGRPGNEIGEGLGTRLGKAWERDWGVFM